MEYFPTAYNSNDKMSIRTTSQSIKDFEKLQRRVENAGSNLQMVTSYLENAFGRHVTVNALLQLANNLCDKHSISIDRLATRNRKALFCWYTENWHIIRQSIPKINSHKKMLMPHNLTPRVERKQPVTIDISDIAMLLNYH